jgi:D-aminoacyl-tRNA deacylase
MRAIIQRVNQASVEIEDKIESSIKKGYMILIGFENTDTEEDIRWLSRKIVQLRVFNDNKGKMNHSIQEIDGQILLISQFTLFGQTKKGNRPSFIRAATPEVAIPLYNLTIKTLEKDLGKPIQTGIFGADMNVTLSNDGPVTLIIDTKNKE